MTAIGSLLAGLIDYAGLYPPAGLDMHTAVRNYLAYLEGEHAAALGRFIVDISRLKELREVAGDSLRDLRLSVIASGMVERDNLKRLIDDGFPIDMMEIEVGSSAGIERISQCIPSGLMTYFEVPFEDDASESLAAIRSAGARTKLRMGGVVVEAFPTSEQVAKMLRALANRRIPFKATAGLHHAIRAPYHFTYKADSLTGTMHGFINLCYAAALVYFGGEVGEAQRLLEEEDPATWKVKDEAIGGRAFHWSADQLSEVRREFLISFGSCSFEEPIHDLEALGWL